MKITLPLKQILILFLLAGYLFLSVFSLIHMSHMSMHGMDMTDCPYFPFEQLPGNDMGAHLQGWQNFSQIILPLFSLFAALCFPFFLALFRQVLPTIFFVPKRSDFDPPPLWEQLFSQGILHPKAP